MSSSSSPSSSTWYDVFLSSRGEATRRNFVCHLYRSLVRKGIRVFRDENDKIPEPSEIHQAVILKASKIALIVISKNYASAPWCLEELAEILEFQCKASLTIFPVYYGIEHDDVIGNPEEFAVHHQRRNPKMVERWRKLLIDLVCIPGEHSNQWEDDAELIRKITDDIWNKLSSSSFGGLVGMDQRMLSVYQLLHLDSKEDEVAIGIWGRAGLGKRTLAKFVYREISHRFDLCVLLESFDMIHHGHNPLDLSELLLTKFTNALASPDMISRDNTALFTG